MGFDRADDRVIAPAGPRLAALGAHIGVPVRVAPLQGARVLWLNERWWLAHGFDIREPDARAQQARALLDRYAVRVKERLGPESADATPRYFADRYGGSGGAQHGGSGRCVTFGDFNAKGVGRTPLAADNVDWGHRHGFLPLSDAIREAICAEVAAAELPHGAVPIVAIIDTGEDFQADAVPVRGAIVVRPNFIRPAHFERSIYFGSSGAPGSDQYVDALRVKAAIEAATRRPGDLQVDFHGPADMFRRFARQNGSSRAARLWQGRFLTSNLSIDGAFVDFGAFCAVPSWHRAIRATNVAFGDEERFVQRAVVSLDHYFRKYAPNTHWSPPPATFVQELSQISCKAFVETNIDALLPPGAHGRGVDIAGLGERLLEYYNAQQRVTAAYGLSAHLEWIGAPADAGTASAPGTARPAGQLAHEILRAATAWAREGEELAASRRRAERWFRRLTALEYNGLTSAIEGLVSAFTGDCSDAAETATFISRRISTARRRFPVLPQDLDLCAYVAEGDCEAWWACAPETKAPIVIAGATPLSGDLRLFGTRVPVAALQARQAWEHLGRLYVATDPDDFSFDARSTIRIGGRTIRLPAAAAVF